MKTPNVDTLKETFDQVYLKHHIDHENTAELAGMTCAALVKGNTVFIGVSLCDSRDNFNRTRGRQIALGRALYEYRKATDTKFRPRKSDIKRETNELPLCFKVETNSPDDVHEVVKRVVFAGIPWTG